MVSGDNLSGRWAGTVVQGSNTARVFVTIAVQDGAVSGSYEIPTAPSEERTGTFSGTLNGNLLVVTLGEYEVKFELRIHEADGELMIFGYTELVGVAPRFATVTIYKFGNLFRMLAGFWIP
jgi:hypothetical protein